MNINYKGGNIKMLVKKVTFLGSKYWNQRVIDNIIANDFDFNKEVRKTILEEKPLCPCGNYGTRITFKYKGKVYSFNYLTGYPCQC